MADKIMSSLKLFGTLGGGYIGYKYGTKIRDKIVYIYPSLKESYLEPFFKDSVISQDTSFKFGGSLFGMMVGCHLWFISIPGSLVLVTKDYPSIKKLFE
jgi:hypothetical protein